MLERARHWLLGSLLLAGASRAAADPLLGDVGAAYSTAEGANANPANAGFVDRSQVFYEPELFKSDSMNVRYPGFEPTQQNDSGANFLAQPSFVYKATPRLGLAGYIVPPVGLGLSIHKKRVPVIILGSQNYVDFDAQGKIDGAGQAVVGYRFNDRIGIGLKASFQAISFKATLTPSEGGNQLAAIDGSFTNADVALGVRFDVPGRLSFGLAAGLVSMNKTSLNVDTALLQNNAGSANGDAASGANGTVTTPLSSVLVGVQVAAGSRLRLLADAKWTRVNKDQTTYSLVELKEKPRDLHDTLGVRLGGILSMMPGGNVLLGYRNEPASIGPGGNGDGGTAGFGTIDLIEVFTGFVDMVPFQQYSGGLQFGFAPQGTKHPYYQWTLTFGIVYRKASLGIDEKGELPGAYLYKKTSVPVGVTFKF